MSSEGILLALTQGHPPHTWRLNGMQGDGGTMIEWWKKKTHNRTGRVLPLVACVALGSQWRTTSTKKKLTLARKKGGERYKRQMTLGASSFGFTRLCLSLREGAFLSFFAFLFWLLGLPFFTFIFLFLELFLLLSWPQPQQNHSNSRRSNAACTDHQRHWRNAR